MRRAGGNSLGAPLPRRTPTRPQSRPLPPPDQEEEILNPFMGRVLRRSPTNTGVISTVAHEEPTLPPTPQHPDPVVSTPPSGIHNTPSKRRRDDVEREAAQRASSPLKKSSSQEDRPQKPQKPQKQSQKAAVFKVARRESPAQTVEDVERIPSPPEPSETKSEKGFAPKTHPRRSVRLLGPDFEKIQKRDALLQEIAQLEEDLELARDEHVNAANGLSSKHESEKILDLLRRRLLPPEKEPEPDPSARWIDAAMDPFTMLGFNGQWSTQLPPILPPKTPEDDDQPPIISHHPIAMTASEELPYLQVFTPLSFTTNITTIPSDPGQINQTTHQRYTINVHSTSPPGLFTTRMEMVINTRSQAVASVAVSSLDPAAASELRPFIDSISNTKTPYHPALTRNVNILCFAMGEWYRVALKRAKFWHALDKNFGPESKDGVAKAVATMRTRKKRGRKARVASEAESELIDSLDGMDSLARLEAMRISKKELLPHMGRTSMNLDVPYLTGNDDDESSEVRVSWGVEFDWSGVAKNKLAVEVGVPGKCKYITYCPSPSGLACLLICASSQGELLMSEKVLLEYRNCLQSCFRVERTPSQR